MKKYLKFSFFIITAFVFQFCSKSNSSVELTIVSFNPSVDKNLTELKSSLKEQFYIDSIYTIKAELPQEAYYEPRNRYRADKLIRYLRDNYNTEKVIGITDKDISTTSGEYEDWGIMGLAFRPGKSCVISTYRTFRNAKSEEHKKERLKKVVFHEFGHTLGLPHCENSDSCLMTDANGKVSTVDKVTDFCPKCKTKIKKYLRN